MFRFIVTEYVYGQWFPYEIAAALFVLVCFLQVNHEIGLG